METVVLLAVLIGAVSADSHRDRRILLHSDVDIAQAIQTLKADNVQMHKDLINLQSQHAQLQNNVQINISHLQSQNSQLQTTVNHLQSANRGTGSSYVRWGRTVCPANGTTLTYSGHMGGGKWSDTGEAANHVCLTADPIWDYYDENVASGGKMYGVDYEIWQHHAGGTAFFGRNLRDQDAPCAVCHSRRSSAMMIPGRNRCYPGWTQEYSGYLVSGGYDNPAASEYICLDRRPEAIPGGGTNADESVLYLVEGVCGGSLECPPYIDGRELTCVVCTN